MRLGAVIKNSHCVRAKLREMRVAVIGAGAAGLCVARHASANPAVASVAVFEGSRSVGGTWVFDEATGRDAHGRPIHSSMYANMRTNLPKEVMGFPDFPFPKDEPASFVPHTAVRAYLDNYTDHFHLRSLIQFERDVVAVEKEGGNWRVTSRRVGESRERTEAFDACFVCSGHYAVPHTPNFPGAASFLGTQMHSHNYRHPEPFAGLRIAVLGSGPSGTDIALDLASVADSVFMCHNKTPMATVLPANLEQRAGFAEFEGDTSIRLRDDSILEDVDAVIYCTGYEYDYPFLDRQALGLQVSPTKGLSPLYQHLIFIPDPSLIFVGLCKTICPFPQFDAQIRFSFWLLENPGAVPRKEMEKWRLEDAAFRKEAGIEDAVLHLMGPHQWRYNEELCRIAGLPSLIPPVIKDLYDEIHRYRVVNLCTYKDERFELVSDSEYKHIAGS